MTKRAGKLDKVVAWFFRCTRHRKKIHRSYQRAVNALFARSGTRYQLVKLQDAYAASRAERRIAKASR